MTKPRFIYFDLGNVLLNFDREIAFRQMGQAAGISAERVREIVYKDDLQWHYERGDIAGREFYEEFCRQSGTEPDYEALRLAGSAMFALNVRIVPVVGHLEAAGNRLGVFSNTCDAHWDYVSGGRFTIIGALFEVYALSFRIRAMKPEPESYARAAELAGVAPSEIFFVDDCRENVQGALAAGFDAVQYTTSLALADQLRGRGVRFNL